MINRHDELSRNNIKIPKGVIIAGPSGCGKSLFSDVLMNSVNLERIELQSTLLTINPLDAVVNAFEKAKQEKNRIILIDEINLLFDDNPMCQSESNNVYRALISEIDSIKDEDNVFIIVTTSNIDELNDSIYRSGRLDQIINLNYPNSDNRRMLLEDSLVDIKLNKNVTIKDLINYTNQFSVADVIRFANDCKRDLLLENKTELDDKMSSAITNEIILKSNSITNSKKDDDVVAYHEAGHAICSLALKQNVSSISILKYNNSLGNTRMSDEADGVKSKQDLINKLIILYGGRVAESYKYNTEFTGSAEDVIRATTIAKEMVSFLGMYGIEYVTRKENEPLSESKLKQREDIMNNIISEAYNKAKDIIINNNSQLEKIHNLLIRNKTITSSTINKIKINYC